MWSFEAGFGAKPESSSEESGWVRRRRRKGSRRGQFWGERKLGRLGNRVNKKLRGEKRFCLLK